MAAALAAFGKCSLRIKSGFRELRAFVRGTIRCFGSRTARTGAPGVGARLLASEFWILDSRLTPAWLGSGLAVKVEGGLFEVGGLLAPVMKDVLLCFALGLMVMEPIRRRQVLTRERADWRVCVEGRSSLG